MSLIPEEHSLEKMDIFNHYPDISRFPHRVDLVSCPWDSCDYVDKDYSCSEWLKNTFRIVLRPSLFPKKNCFIFMSYCPACGRTSWQHQSFGSICFLKTCLNFPASVIECLEREYERQKKAREERVKNCICSSCSKLKTLHEDYRTCNIGMGPVVKECDSFLEK